MHDLTKGPIAAHIVRLAAPIAAGMIFQTLYYLVDLYFVARLGGTAIAGVSAAGNVQFIVHGADAGPRRGHDGPGVARQRAQGPRRREPDLQPEPC